jgi:hypothetical protein
MKQHLSAVDSNSRAQLTLITAPAGYGNTTLVRTWVQQPGLRTTLLAPGTQDYLRQICDILGMAYMGFDPEQCGERILAFQWSNL